MRTLAMFAILAFVALVGCGGASDGSDGGSSNGSDGGSPPGQCDDTATQICQKAASCSIGHDAAVTVFLMSEVDGGPIAVPFTVNGDVSHCDNFLHLACLGKHAEDLTATCGPMVSGLQCGTDSRYGNGVSIPSTCGQYL